MKATTDKRALLARLLRERTGSESSAPLSPGQRSLWFLEKLNPGTEVFHLSNALWIDGELDPEALFRAVGSIVARHATLRTSFVEVGSRPVQTIAERPRRAASEVDLTALGAAARRRVAEQVADDGATRPFDLQRAPLLRVVLIRLDARRFLMSLTMHHIISDAWSFSVFLAELSEHYAAWVEGRPSPLPPLPTQYADHTRRQLRWLESEAYARELAFWRARLEGAPPSLELPTQRPRPAVRGTLGGEIWEGIPRHLAAGVRRLGERSGSTLFMTLLAAFSTLITRYTGRRDFLVGTSVAGRNRSELTGLIGYFVNMLVLRIRSGQDPTFRTLLGQVREVTVDALAHQDLPFEKLVEELQPDRDLSQDPLFQVIFDAVPYRGGGDVRLGELEMRELIIRRRTAMIDLETHLEERETGEWMCFLRWSTDLFDTSFMIRFLRHFHNLLRAVADDAERRLSELELLSPAERAQLLREWNDTRIAVDPRSSVMGLFAARVEEVPDAVAAVSQAGALSYRELDARAGRVGRWLRDQGVGREAWVGVFGERGLGMLPAILGILKAGAAWVSLDPGHPDERVVGVLSESGTTAILTQEKLASRLARMTAELEPAPAISCWDAVDGIPATGRQDPAPVNGPEDLAYAFYTSGSTGRPKGAMVTHRGMLNHLIAKIDLLRLDSDSVVVQNASHCFDIFVWQLLAPLLAGGRVVVVDGDTAVDPAVFLKVLEEHRVTVLETVPSLLDPLLERVVVERATGKPIHLAALRQLISNAETLPVPLARRWLERFAHVPLINTYGATECSDDTTHEVFRSPPPASAPRMAVGRPIRGFAIYVLDAHLQPVPAGCQGQIGMAGVGVGRGYLGDRTRTAAVFVPDPFAESAGERLYLSGDLGRFTSTGVLEFLGRFDSQVKVRGYRIELGEIEAVLARHAAVQQVAVVVSSEGGANRLVAYLVAQEALDPAALRTFLARSLPQYMVPEQFIQLAAMPVNRNGKIDRRALPEPPPMTGGDAYVAPRTELEARIAAIWEDLLGVEKVSVDDGFFELGGHSLKAIQLTTRMQHELGIEISVRQLFFSGSVAKLAATLSEERGEAAPELPPIERRTEQPSYELSIAQEAQWASLQILARDVRKLPEILDLVGDPDLAALRAAIRALVARHEILRTSFAEVTGEPRQTIHATVEIRVHESDLSDLDRTAQQQQLRQIFAQESRVFDLATPPLLRARLVRLETSRHLLLLSLPHIVSDGWSEQLIFQELARLYNDLRAGRESPDPPRLRYVDYAAWQRRHLDAPAMIAQRDFWIDQLRDTPPALPLPADRFAPGEEAGTGATVVLERDLAARVDALASRRSATSFMVYTAAFQALLTRWTGRTDGVVGSALAGRARPELEELIGLFIHPVALRVQVALDAGFGELVDRVRQTTLAAIAHQDYPFHRWLEQIRRERRDSDYLPFSVSIMPQKEPILAPFDGLEVRYRPLLELLDESIAEVGPAGESAAVGLEQLTGGASELTLGVFEQDDEVRLILASGSGRFRQDTLDRLLSQLGLLLEQVTRNPDRRLEEIFLVAGESERRFLAELARGSSAPPPGEALTAAIEAWARQGTAEAVAIVSAAGEVVAADDPELLDPYELRRFLLRHQATLLVAGPPILEGLAALPDEVFDALPIRRLVSVGTPPLSAVRLARGAELELFFPLAERSAVGLWARAGSAEADGVLFAGHPLPGHPVRLLDAAREPVPPGILGEITLEAGGDLVAAGYRGRWRADGTLDVVDRSAAAIPPSAPPVVQRPAMTPYLAPRTALERRLAVTWQKVLDLPQVGIEDDFFALGGTAARAVRAALRLADSDLLLLPGQIAQHRTIAALAPVVDRAPESSDAAPAPLTPLQEALIGGDPGRIVRSASLEVAGCIDPDSLERALTALARRHDALRATFVREGGLWMQGLRESPEMPLERIELTGATEEEREASWQRAVDELRGGVEPISGPPLRALFGCGDSRPRLALAVSGLVADDDSWPVIVADLAAEISSSHPDDREAAPSFHRWLVAAERLRCYRESRGTDSLPVPALSPRWTGARFHRIELPPVDFGDDLEALVAAALGRILPGGVEVERNRRGGAPAQPRLAAAVGQFGTLWPEGSRDDRCRARLRLLAAPAARDDRCLSLREVPSPPPVVVAEGDREPDLLVRVTPGPQALVAELAVRPGVPGLSSEELAQQLAYEIEQAATTRLSGSASEEESPFAHVELDQADLDEIFG